MLRKRKVALIILSVLLAVFAAGCKKEPPPPPPPPTTGSGAGAASKTDGDSVGRAEFHRTRQVSDPEVVLDERNLRLDQSGHWGRADKRQPRSLPDPKPRPTR